MRDWIGSPREWGEWGMRATAWFNELVDDQSSQDSRLTAAETALTGVGASSYVHVPADVYTGWSLAGAPYSPSVVYRNRDGLIGMDGVLTCTVARSAFDPVIQLRAGFRPPVDVVIPASCSVANTSLYVEATGIVRCDKAIAIGQYVSLGGLVFRT